jgi:DUF1680 family protein
MLLDTHTISLAAGLLMGAAIFAAAGPARSMPPLPPDQAKLAIKLKAEPFDLAEVRLLDGPFKHAMELDKAYLLSLDPDRLLYNFKVTAGLPTTATPYGGWEAPNSEVRGHFVGHYLSACALMYRSTGDEQLRENAARVVAGMAQCQQKIGTGYVSGFPEEEIERVINLKPVWAPWYTIHKIFAGLLEQYRLCGNQQALDVLKKAADWAKARTDKLTDAQMQSMLETEQGGMNEVLANLYAVTGERKYLDLSIRFNHHAVIDPLIHQQDRLDGLHANTQFPKIIGIARQYELTGDSSLRTGAEFFWNDVTKERSYVTGGDSDGEHFSPKAHLSQYLSPTTTETCNSYNMLKLTRHLFCWTADEGCADYYERTLYNHILASQNPETGMMVYYLALKTGWSKGEKTPFGFCTPTDSFWCCTGTGVENHAKYGGSIYFHDGGRGLYVNLFIPSTLDWAERGVVLTQETGFPTEPKTRLTFTCKRPVRLALCIRHPFWAAAGFEVRVNGKAQKIQGGPASYAVINRTWHTGDVVEVALPMTVRTEGFKDDPRRVALMYGPLVLCSETAPNDGNAFILEDLSIVASELKPVSGAALTFEAPGRVFRTSLTDVKDKVTFLPFYQEYKNHYVIYWDDLTDDQWRAKLDANNAEIARAQALKTQTVDEAEWNADSERAHNLQEGNSGSGDFEGKRWRDAHDGGWFSVDLKIQPDHPEELMCEYWGSDAGGREFDILVDGQKIATQTLNNNHPGEFFDQTYPIPAELIAGKGHVTIRFQAHPGMMAGGVFDLRMLKGK